MRARSAQRTGRSLREEHRARTRQRILQALVEHLSDQGLQDLSLPAVARRARVSVPTIYRHFPTRDALMDAFAAWVKRSLGYETYQTTADGLIDMVQEVYAWFDQNEQLVRAHVSTAVGREFLAHARPERVKAVEQALESVTADLEPLTARQILGIFQLLISAQAWLSMRDNCGLDGMQAGKAAAWVMRVLLAELRNNPHTVQEEGS